MLTLTAVLAPDAEDGGDYTVELTLGTSHGHHAHDDDDDDEEEDDDEEQDGEDPEATADASIHHHILRIVSGKISMYKTRKKNLESP